MPPTMPRMTSSHRPTGAAASGRRAERRFVTGSLRGRVRLRHPRPLETSRAAPVATAHQSLVLRAGRIYVSDEGVLLGGADSGP